MRKTIFWVVICITLLVFIRALYFAYAAFFDDRMFLKNETERVVSHLNNVRIGEEFNLSGDCIACDSIFIITPYDTRFFERNTHLKLWPNIKRRISSITWDDSQYQMLFVKGNKVVGFAEINNCVTFNGNNQDLKFPVNATLYLDQHRIIQLK